MFDNPFSCDGRIRRLEYGISVIIVIIVLLFIFGNNLHILFIKGSLIPKILFSLFLMVLFKFLWAQGCKRCHDRGNNRFFQFIPFYVFWMLFADGEYGENWYGPNPKGLGNVDADEE